MILLEMCLASHAKEGLEVSYMEIYRTTEEQPVPDTYCLNRHFFHSLEIYLQPGNWQLSVKNECRHSPDGSEKISFFSDAALSYKTQKYELKVSCNNLLGTNKREYRSLSITGSSYSITELRPREVLASVIFNL